MFSILKVCSFIRYSFCEELAIQLGRESSSEMVSQTGRIYTDSLSAKGRITGRESRLQWCRAAVGTGHLGVMDGREGSGCALRLGVSRR